MRLTTLPLAVIGTALASPSPEPLPAATAPTPYTWSVTKWSFCRGATAYDYSITVTGATNGGTPAFTAKCSGTQKGSYKPCSVLSVNGAPVPNVDANVNIVVDPKNPNDSIPRVFVRTTYTDTQGCSYTSTGFYDAAGNCGSSTGSRFKIAPKDTAVC